MPNYAPTVNPGDERARIWRMTIENALGQAGSIIAHEETVVRVASGERSLGRSRDMAMQYDPAQGSAMIELRHPVTDQIVGTATIDDAYAMIYSLARHLQKIEDQKQVQE